MIEAVVYEDKANYGPPDQDGLWKKLIQELFEEFMEFFAPNLHQIIDYSKPPEFLQQELFKEIIQELKGRNIADQIVKVYLQNGEEKWILIHIEVQGKNNQEFRKRMFRYFYRIFDKFDKEVFAIALLTDDEPSTQPHFFHYSFYGTTVKYKYNSYEFSEHSIETLEKSDNPFASAVIAGKYASQFKHETEKRYYFKRKLMLQILNKFNKEKQRARIYLTALFYFIDYLLQTPKDLDQKLKSELIKRIQRKGGFNMQLQRKDLSPTLAGIIEELAKDELEKATKEGIQLGRQEGIKEGIKEGKKEGKKDAKKEIAISLINNEFSDEKVAEITGLSLKVITGIRNSLKAK